LVILALALGFLWFGLDPLLRWGLVSLGQAVTGAKVEIGRLRTSVWRTEISLSDVQVADPASPMENLFEARQVKLGLEGNSLLRRKFIVREGIVSGLRLGTPRATSGALEKQPREPERKGPSLLEKQLAEFAQAWLESLAARLQQEVRDEVQRLQSVQLAREMVRRWPIEYDRMEGRIDALRARVDELRRLAQGGGRDLLQNLEAMRKAAADVEGIQHEIGQFHSEIDRLRQQAVRDKEAIAAAEKQDAQTIRQRFRLENLNGENLSEFLLGDQWGERLWTAVRWIEWGRKHLPSTGKSLAPVRSRGVDVVFRETPKQPDFLIRHLAIDGEGTVNRQPFQFVGTAEGLTNQPAVYGEPAVLNLEVHGAATMTIAALLDHTGQTPHERLSVECPDLHQPQRVLGRPDRLALSVSPGKAKLRMDLELQGDALAGKVHWQQEPVELTPVLPDRYGGPRLAGELKEGLRQIRLIEVAVDLGGTLQKPQCKLRSDLGRQFAEALNSVVQRELESRQAQLAALLQETVEAELARFQQTVSAKEQAVLAKLQQSGADLNQLQQLVGHRVPLPGALRDKLPDNVRDKLPAEILDDGPAADLGKRLREKLPLRF
jgi:uncharacterized protein (TIGR03545 family)